MNKTLTGVIVAVLAVIVIGGLLIMGNNDGDPTTANTSQTDQSASNNSNSESSNNGSPEQNTTEAVQQSNVDIKDYAYTPPKIQVKKGTKVTWTNQDSVRHDVTPDSEGSDFKASELLDNGESYSFTFNTVGTYTYHCSPHPYMKGTVEVVE
jgi:amicyanin